MTIIKKDIKCKECKGTGLYIGVCEGDGTAVVCTKCSGSGCYKLVVEYEEFTGRLETDGVSRVYKANYGYKIGTGVIDFSGVKIDMDKEGISYEEFFNGKMPEHTRKLTCPMAADQSECHNIGGFTDACHAINGGWLGYIPDCKWQCRKSECWDRFDEYKA